jgi:hypothetical protein
VISRAASISGAGTTTRVSEPASNSAPQLGVLAIRLDLVAEPAPVLPAAITCIPTPAQ